jgi:hypothetical protein
VLTFLTGRYCPAIASSPSVWGGVPCCSPAMAELKVPCLHGAVSPGGEAAGVKASGDHPVSSEWRGRKFRPLVSLLRRVSGSRVTATSDAAWRLDVTGTPSAVAAPSDRTGSHLEEKRTLAQERGREPGHELDELSLAARSRLLEQMMQMPLHGRLGNPERSRRLRHAASLDYGEQDADFAGR